MALHDLRAAYRDAEVSKWCVLGGGGGHGAFQAGALAAMTAAGRSYDGFVGCSIGAVHAAFMAQYARESQAQGAQDLVELWRGIRGAKDVYRSWYYGLLGPLPLLWKSSRYSSRPLEELIARHITELPLVECLVGAVEITSRKDHVFRLRLPCGPQRRRAAVLASASFPTLLPAVQIDGLWWTDWGVRENTPIATAIDQGATAIDVISCEPSAKARLPVLPQEEPSAVKVAWAAVSAALDEVIEDDLWGALRVNEMVRCGCAVAEARGWRLVSIKVVRPEDALSADSMGDAEGEALHPQTIARNLERGRLMARRFDA